MSLSIKRDPKYFYGYFVVGTILIIVVISHGAQYTFRIFFKPILTEFGRTRVATSGTFSLYMILLGAIIGNRGVVFANESQWNHHRIVCSAQSLSMQIPIFNGIL